MAASILRSKWSDVTSDSIVPFLSHVLLLGVPFWLLMHAP